MNSHLYLGTLRHRRFEPRPHDFQYHVLMFYVDLDEVDRLFRVPFLFSHRFPRWIGFDRRHYLKSRGLEQDLKSSVKKLIQEKTGETHVGSIRLLTQLSYFGFCFNPVSFYYCFNPEGKLRFVVSEITNTPWNERRVYVHKITEDRKHHRYEFQKDFHISPFMPMEMHYRWNFSSPDPSNPMDWLSVHMENWDPEQTRRVFDATLMLKARPWTWGNLIVSLIRFPLLTFKSFLAIYVQAFLLKLKKTPFYPHPDSGGPS
jgi:DUF1365 family protein